MRWIPGALVPLIFASFSTLAGADSLPPPLTSPDYHFPGAVASPGSAASAGVGMADAWLGDEPFENPALPAANRASLSPLLYHMSRQDLRGLDRGYTEQSAFFDGAGGWVGVHRGSLTAFAYGHQPILRLEENAYVTGPQSGVPTPVENAGHSREVRGGVGVSTGRARWRAGVAGEVSYRNDSYETTDASGSPISGTSHVDFSGTAFGGQAGARLELGPDSVNRVVLGAAVRFVPELTLDGQQEANLVATGSSSGPVSVTRESGIEAGLSARWTATPQLNVFGGFGGRTAQDWKGFGVTRGAGTRWGLGVAFHDSRDPWTLRFGVGQEQEKGSDEPTNGVVGVGIGWNLEGTIIDVAALRHSFSHLGGATSYDDRVLLGIVLPF